MAARTSPRGSPAACPFLPARPNQPLPPPRPGCRNVPGAAAASKVLGNVQGGRDSQQHHLKELAGALISLQHPSWSLPGSSSPGSVLLNQKTRKHTPKEALKLVKPSFLLVREYEEKFVDNRLLPPQHLCGIWIGQDQYRLPLAPLNEFPEPWCWKMSGRSINRTYI